ncbi:B-cell receptor CD22 isoform X1 [Embiotoca jacksoni]|uniref:B-cell receptor CD22 isoform X1 n=1 Tax=Embiotoca jacksoni TaxID=100190 RepID=UPI0037041DE4
MKMNAHTVRWFVFLALINNSSRAQPNPFSLEVKHLTAKAGSCIEMSCKVTNDVESNDAYWFWMKDAKYNGRTKTFDATIVYSSDQVQRPVSQGFENRVNYTGSLSSTWTNVSPQESCSIMLCGLNKTDSGNFSFRYIHRSKTDIKWVTEPGINLKVENNPCLILFKKQPPVKENTTVTLECSTSTSCTSNLRIEALTQQPLRPNGNLTTENPKSSTYMFTAHWKDDGIVFSCFTEDNTDKYLIQNISVTVEYAPTDTKVTMSSEHVTEGDSVTLTCSANGQPKPNFSWFQNDQQKSSESSAEWTFAPTEVSQNLSYFCKAENKHGSGKSGPVTIDVQYAPEVEIWISQQPVGILQNATQGDLMSFTCHVKRSNPKPLNFSWYKNEAFVSAGGNYDVVVEPEDSGVYTCEADNKVKAGRSEGLQLKVRYRPRNSRISIHEAIDYNVKVNSRLTFTCNTDADPQPWYSWYRYKQTDPSRWTLLPEMKSNYSKMALRSDDACYVCNATNFIGSGNISQPVCIKVLFPPTKTVLSMNAEVSSGQLVKIACTTESYPPSAFTLTLSADPKWIVSKPADDQNSFHHEFTATSANAGYYTCCASNAEGRNISVQRRLVVKYTPEEVKVETRPGLIVKENTSVTLDCSARSYPSVTSVTWMKMTNGKKKLIKGAQKTFSVKSAGPSDSGLYSCSATNEIGTTESQQVEVKVMYAPKHTGITKGEEEKLPDGTSSVLLSCWAHCYPPVQRYSWYRKTEDGEEDEEHSKSQNISVNSNRPGEYYCVAKNEISQRASDPINPFHNMTMKAVKFFCLFLLHFLILILIFFWYRRRRNKPVQQGAGDTQPRCGFLGWWSGVRRGNLINEMALADHVRSRDELLPDQPQRCQTRPDSTPASSDNVIYSKVKLPHGQQAASAQQPHRPHGGHVDSDSLNYSRLHFANKQKKPAEDVVYAKVAKPKPSEEKQQESLGDYENIYKARAAKLPTPSDYDTDTSEDEVEVNYAQVTFKTKLGHQRSNSDSDSFEDKTQYSDIKI